MSRDPRIIWLPPHVETRKSEHRSDAEWERIFRQGVRARELQRQGQNIFRPDEEVPMFLRKQAGEDYSEETERFVKLRQVGA